MNNTTNQFDKAATGWDKKKYRIKLALAIAESICRLPLTDKMQALDYGCGTGLVGLAVAKHVGHLTAMDTSTSMLDVLQKKLTAKGIKNVTLRNVDLTREFYNGRFDLIFCAMTMHHLEDPKRVIETFGRMLNPGGFLAIADLDLEDGSFHAPNSSDVRHHGFDRKDLHDQLTNVNLSDIRDQTVHVYTKKDKEGVDKKYTVFLITGNKENRERIPGQMNPIVMSLPATRKLNNPLGRVKDIHPFRPGVGGQGDPGPAGNGDPKRRGRTARHDNGNADADAFKHHVRGKAAGGVDGAAC